MSAPVSEVAARLNLSPEEAAALLRTAERARRAFAPRGRPARLPPPEAYLSPLSLPARRVGSMRVTHAHEARCPLVGMRQALMRGAPAVSLRFDPPLRVHELHEVGRGLWMSDRPEEVFQIYRAVRRVRPRGRVLVGGLGLGLWAALIARHPGVEEVVVVERNPDVAALCGAGHRVELADIGDYLARCDPFDYFFLDTWAGTGECAWWEDVMPLRRTIRRRFGRQAARRTDCWAEDIMLPQVLEAAASRRAGSSWYYAALHPGTTLAQARWFVREVGSPSWEAKYGARVDAALAEHAG